MTDLERQILDFESQWWRARGNKETEIRQLFGWSVMRYAQKLNQVVDNPGALEHDPILVNRLRRIRSERVDARAQRRDLK